MAKRLIDWRTINREKIKRGRSWIFGEMAAGRFPQPVVRGAGSNLWDEEHVDRWLDEFVARANGRQVHEAEAA